MPRHIDDERNWYADQYAKAAISRRQKNLPEWASGHDDAVEHAADAACQNHYHQGVIVALFCAQATQFETGMDVGTAGLYRAAMRTACCGKRDAISAIMARG